MKKNSYKDFVLDNFQKTQAMAVAALISIAVFELIFLIRGIFAFKDKFAQKVYISCYSVLFFAAVFSLVLVFIHMKKRVPGLMFFQLHAFDIIVTLWSLVISLMDVYNKSYPIVFVTVMFTLPFFIVLNPVFNSVMIAIGLGAILCVQITTAEYTTSGYVLNLIVFATMAIMINLLCYRANLKNYILENQLKDASTHDGLTGLFNRSALDTRLEELEKEHVRRSIIMLDCDYFKKLNDSYGHRFGDECLEAIAQLLTVEFGNECFRYGGDEFLIISELTNDRMQKKLAQINSELAERFQPAKVSITAGIYNIDGECKAKEMLQRSDEALYNAKENKRGTSMVYVPAAQDKQ